MLNPSLPFSFVKRKFSPVSFLFRVYLGLPPDPDTPPPMSHLGEGVSPKALGPLPGAKRGPGRAWGQVRLRIGRRLRSASSRSPNLARAAGRAGAGRVGEATGGDRWGWGGRHQRRRGAGPELIRQSPVLLTSMFRLLSEEKIHPLRTAIALAPSKAAALGGGRRASEDGTGSPRGTALGARPARWLKTAQMTEGT